MTLFFDENHLFLLINGEKWVADNKIDHLETLFKDKHGNVK